MVPAMSDLPDHVRRNREAWDRYAPQYVEPGHRAWASDTPSWGIFDVPDAHPGVLPRRLDGLDAIELGCGTAYVSAWLARRGARPVGIDNSPAPPETAPRPRPPPPAATSRSSASSSRCTWATPSRRRFRTTASIWRSPSTAPASGATPTAGYRRRRACCARADS